MKSGKDYQTVLSVHLRSVVLDSSVDSSSMPRTSITCRANGNLPWVHSLEGPVLAFPGYDPSRTKEPVSLRVHGHQEPAPSPLSVDYVLYIWDLGA